MALGATLAQACVLLLLAFFGSAKGHGYLLQPSARNLVAHKAGQFWDEASGNGLGRGNIGNPGEQTQDRIHHQTSSSRFHLSPHTSSDKQQQQQQQLQLQHRIPSDYFWHNCCRAAVPTAAAQDQSVDCHGTMGPVPISRPYPVQVLTVGSGKVIVGFQGSCMFSVLTGVCGDPFQTTNSNFIKQPSAVQDTYVQGAVVELKVVLTTNHGGKFTFRVCPRRDNLDEACFGNNYLTRVDNGQQDTWIMDLSSDFIMQYQLPPQITCEAGCVLQWSYYSMQSCVEPGCDRKYCGVYADGDNAVYRSNPGFCGRTTARAEFFNNCADICIVPAQDSKLADPAAELSLHTPMAPTDAQGA